jgi:hypothetical protein
VTTPKTIKDFFVLAAIIGGTVLPAIGFLLYFTDRGSPVIFNSIAITVAIFFGILLWFGLGLAGILRAIGTALITSGVVCLMPRPVAGLVCLLIGIVCRLAASRLTLHIHQSDSKKV